MNQYKLTNRISGATENLNQKQLENRIKKSSGNFAFIYSKELISPTPIQDYMNQDRLSALDVIAILLCTFALAVGNFLLLKSII
jgi:hypothetical protein